MKRHLWIALAIALVVPQSADAQQLQRICDSPAEFWCFEVTNFDPGNMDVTFDGPGLVSANPFFSLWGYWRGPAFDGIQTMSWITWMTYQTSGGALGTRRFEIDDGPLGSTQPGVETVKSASGGLAAMWNPDDYGEGLEVVTTAIQVGWFDRDSEAFGGCAEGTCHYVFVSEPGTLLLVLTGLVGLVALRRRRAATDVRDQGLAHPVDRPV